MYYLPYILLLTLFALGIFLALKSKKAVDNNADLLDKLGLTKSSLDKYIYYPSLGLKIWSNIEIVKPLALQKWNIDFVGNFVCEIEAKSFSSALYKFELNLAKAGIRANHTDVYLYLATHGIIQQNENLNKP